MKLIKKILKIRLIHCQRFPLVWLIVFQLFNLSGFYGIVVLKEKAVALQAGAEPVIAGIFVVMFLAAFVFTYWYLFRDKSFYLIGQYKKYEMRGDVSTINQTLELSGSGEYELTIEVIWKPGKEDMPREQSFHLASSRKGNYVKARVTMEIVPDNSSRESIEFEQYPNERLNVGHNIVGKTLDKVEISCNEKITLNITAQIERHETLAIKHDERFLIRVYNSLNLQEAFHKNRNEISFS